MINVWTRTGRSVAQVKVVPRLTSEFKVYCIPQRNDKTPRAKKCLRNWFVRSKRTQTERRWKPIFSKINRTIQPAESQRTWPTAWWTWSTSRCARSLPKSSALSVWRIARKGSCAADADSAYIRQINAGTKQGPIWCPFDSKLRDTETACPWKRAAELQMFDNCTTRPRTHWEKHARRI